MSKILVLYYSTYGHVETMANAIAEGARSVDGTEVTIKRVPETMPPEVAKQYGAKLDQSAPVADPKELGNYDAIIFGTPTRFGNMAAQMRNFLDQTGSLWMQGAGGAHPPSAGQRRRRGRTGPDDPRGFARRGNFPHACVRRSRPLLDMPGHGDRGI